MGGLKGFFDITVSQVMAALIQFDLSDRIGFKLRKRKCRQHVAPANHNGQTGHTLIPFGKSQMDVTLLPDALDAIKHHMIHQKHHSFHGLQGINDLLL